MSSILQSPTTAPGRFGPYGGRYVPETLMVPLFELERAYEAAKSDAAFQARFQDLLKNFAGRPTPLQFASRLTEKLGGPRIYLKREDLLHTGAHKINNAIGQGLLAVKMGKPRIIAETGAGQHGVASATVAAHLGLECVVYMGTEDMARQALNVARMRMLGAQVVAVDAGGRGGQLGEHAARLAAHQGFAGARPGVLQGTYTYVLQNEDGQIATTHSISAGLDYPAIGPEHAWLADQRRAEYFAVTDAAALDAAQLLARTEGIIPALESAHAIAGLIERVSSSDSADAPHAGVARGSLSVATSSRLTANDLVIINLSGRGDKDMATYSRFLGEKS